MNKRNLIIISIVLIAALCRLLPHLPNFTPLVAMSLFAGAYLRNRYTAVLIPIAAMLISDAFTGFSGWMFPEQVAVVYGSFALIALIGTTLNNDKGILRIGASTLAGSILFFVTTNFAVWMGGMFHAPALYPMNGTGLLECYIAAIPFFTNSLMGDLFYSAVLFGGFYLATINIPSLREESI